MKIRHKRNSAVFLNRFSILVILLLATACGGGRENSPTTATFSISGRIVCYGEGLGETMVSLTGPRNAQTTTDASGNYTFTGLAEGSYTIIPSRPGHAFEPTMRSVSVNGEHVAGEDIAGYPLGCGGRSLGLQYDPALKIDRSVGETVAPPVCMDVREGSFTLPPPDWERNADSTLSDNLALAAREYISDYESMAFSQPQKTKFSGWDLNPFFCSVNTMYLLTGDNTYLDRFKMLYEYFLSVRMDKQNRSNYEGLVLPQWERLDRYNIFSISPYKSYTDVDNTTLMNERGWQSLYFSDVNYSGLFLDQMLRFAQIVHRYGLAGHAALADNIIGESTMVVESHEGEWVQVSSTEGYYKFPKGCPFYLDGVEIPINEAAVFGTALVRLHLLTGESRWLERARSMWRHWIPSLALDRYGYITYPYVLGSWRTGWQEADNVSVNSPSAPSTEIPETFHKAALTIQFMILLETASPGTTHDYLLEFKNAVLAAQATGGTEVSEFPSWTGFIWPLNTYHATPISTNHGWVGLLHDNPGFHLSLYRYWIANRRDYHISTPHLLYGVLLGRESGNVEQVRKSIVIKPDLMEDEATACHILEDKPNIANLYFTNLTPKHNTLYLYVNKSQGKRLRLNIGSSGRFEGVLYVPANLCIVLTWLPADIYSYPQSAAENVVDVEMFWVGSQ